MTKAELSKYKEILEAKKTDLVHRLLHREDLEVEKSSDPMDETQGAADRELAVRNLDRESTLLREVKLALSRIEDHSFGTCLICDEAINPKRLAALPWAPRCLSCQEEHDNRHEQGDADGFDPAFTTA